MELLSSDDEEDAAAAASDEEEEEVEEEEGEEEEDYSEVSAPGDALAASTDYDVQWGRSRRVLPGHALLGICACCRLWLIPSKRKLRLRDLRGEPLGTSACCR